MSEVLIYADGDDRVVEGCLGDVIQTLQKLPSVDQYMLGVVAGVALSRITVDKPDFHTSNIDALGADGLSSKVVRVALSMVGTGWGLRILEDQQLRIIE